MDGNTGSKAEVCCADYAKKIEGSEWEDLTDSFSIVALERKGICLVDRRVCFLKIILR
jgi:hypothetical protein